MSDDFETWLGKQPLPMEGDVVTLPKLVAQIKAAWNAGAAAQAHEYGNIRLIESMLKDTPEEIAEAIRKVRSDAFQMDASRPEILGVAFTLAEALTDKNRAWRPGDPCQTCGEPGEWNAVDGRTCPNGHTHDH